MKINIPYGDGFLSYEDNRISAVYNANVAIAAQEDADEIVRKAMSNPISSKKLSDLAKGKEKATIIISDHTRPVPSRNIIPHMLSELRSANPDIKIVLLVATGCHRSTSREELVAKLGEDIYYQENIIVHDCDDKENLVNIGKLPSGADLIVNRQAVETDLLIAEGFIEPHFFAGFSGGRKSVLPGICSRKTVLGNHCSKFIDNPNSTAGIVKNNPIHEDMISAARMINLQYIVNVIIDNKRNVVEAFAGDAIEAHAEGCRHLMKECSVHCKQKYDVVITSNGGYPIDQNVYQAVKGISTAAKAVNERGIIIMCAECRDGIGGESFYRHLKDCDTISDLLQEIRRVQMDETVPDQWQYQILAKVLEKHEIIFVTKSELKERIEEMKMIYAERIEEAIQKAIDKLGESINMCVIPDGVATIIVE